MTDYEKRSITRDAQRAYRLGMTPNEACPHPFHRPQGLHWFASYWCTGIEGY